MAALQLQSPCAVCVWLKKLSLCMAYRLQTLFATGGVSSLMQAYFSSAEYQTILALVAFRTDAEFAARGAKQKQKHGVSSDIGTAVRRDETTLVDIFCYISW